MTEAIAIHDIVHDASQLKEDLPGMAHRLIEAYAGPLTIDGNAWNLVVSRDDEHSLTIPVPDHIQEPADLYFDFIFLQWYKRRSHMQQIIGIEDTTLRDINEDAPDDPDLHARVLKLFSLLIEHYSANKVNNEPRFGDLCPTCYGEGEVHVGSSAPDDEGYQQCPTCLNGKGLLPTLQEYVDGELTHNEAYYDLMGKLTQVVEVLKELVRLKDLKDAQGKTTEYHNLQPVTWAAAREVIKECGVE